MNKAEKEGATYAFLPDTAEDFHEPYAFRLAGELMQNGMKKYGVAKICGTAVRRAPCDDARLGMGTVPSPAYVKD